VTFPTIGDWAEYFNGGYSMFDNANGSLAYFSNLTPASLFAGSAKAMDLSWNVTATVYNELIAETQPVASVLSKYHDLGEGLAEVGLPFR
jgi:hypothetical protein